MSKVSVTAPKCPSCNKSVYHAERVYYHGKDYHSICYGILIKQEAAAAPKTFAIHEQIFCNPDENVKHKYPLAPKDGYGIPEQQPVSPKQSSPQLRSTSSPSPPRSPQQQQQQQRSSAKTCIKCTNEVKTTDKFCTGCGTKVLP